MVVVVVSFLLLAPPIFWSHRVREVGRHLHQSQCVGWLLFNPRGLPRSTDAQVEVD